MLTHGRRSLRWIGRISAAVSAVVLLSLPLTGNAEEATQAKPLSHGDMVKQATAQSASANRIERLADDWARVPATMQAIEAFASPDSVTFVSTSKDEPGSFTIRPVSLGRIDGKMQTLPAGKVAVQQDRAGIIRPNLTEELTTSADGVRQDFIINTAPKGKGELALDLAFEGAKLSKKGDWVGIMLEHGRELVYHKLLVTDKSGKQLPARFELKDAGNLRIVVADAGAVYPLRIDPTVADADWVSIALPDANTVVSAFAWDGTNLYVGGTFSGIGGNAAVNIAKWDGSSWSALGAGINNTVYALLWDGTNLYAGGNFTAAGGVSANFVAKWDGSNWSALGTGMNGNVNALAWDGTNLYAGGYFSAAGGTSANYIARWNGSSWSALGTGMDSTVYALLWDGTNLYAGGQFTTAGGTSANYIAKWDGSSWSGLGTGMDSTVYALLWDGTNPYAGGQFTTAGGTSANRIARWNGSSWSALGTGMNGTVLTLAWNGTNLYAGGFFTTAGGTNANSIAKWNGSSWSALGTGINNTVYALHWDGTNLYAGGQFTTAGGTSANRIARWNGSNWSALGTGMNGIVSALLWDGTNLYAGGQFTTAGGTSANSIVKWNGSSWSALGTGMNSYVNALAWDGTNLYAGGYFTTAGGTSANRIARWNGNSWSALGTGMNGIVSALLWDGTNLYAGGQFTTAGGTSANRIAKWNGSSWSALGTGMNSYVNALAWDGTNLYAGGYFSAAGGMSANYIAKWDGSSWSSLGTGMSGVMSIVSALLWDGTNLYAGGQFTTAGGTSANSIAKWNGSSWSSLGTGMNSYVYALAWDGTNLYAGGYFTIAGGMSANRIAKWNGSNWSVLGTGMNGTVYALAWDGTNLYAGGSFSQAGSDPARVAYFPVKHTVSTSVGANGNILPVSRSVSHGETTTFTITPDGGYSIGIVDSTCGTGQLNGSTYTTSTVMNDCAVNAAFAPITHLLSVSVTGTGTVHTAPGTDLTCTSNCGASYNEGTIVTLTATPGSGYTLTGWSGDCSGTGTCQVTMNSAKSVGVTFVFAGPDPFAFVDQVDIPLNSVMTSNSITVTGISGSVLISVTGGEYEINHSGFWTNLNGTVNNGDNVRVRQTSSPDPATTTETVLTIGSVSDTFSVTTTDQICAQLAIPGSNLQLGPSINDLGQSVWSQLVLLPPGLAYSQIMSSERGQLTSDAVAHGNPSLNNRGDVVWQKEHNIYCLFNDQSVPSQVTFTGDTGMPSINDSREIVWSKIDNGTWQIYSNQRGRLTSDPFDHLEPSINNAGDVVWAQYDPETGWEQVYMLAAGASAPARITSDMTNHYSPSISNNGEVVWTQGPDDLSTRIYSNTRGQLTTDGCPKGRSHMLPSVNQCGDVMFTNFTSDGGNSWVIYRWGNSSPCVFDQDQNDSMYDATPVAGNSTTLGTVQQPGDGEDWYSFGANAGDTIDISVNWTPAPSSDLMVELATMAGVLAVATEPGSPKKISVVAGTSGTYYVHLMAVGENRIGYSLTIQVGTGGGWCAAQVARDDYWGASAINDLGKMVWTEGGQIHSNMRTPSQVTSDPSLHIRPSLNNRGDIVWVQDYNMIFGLLNGVATQLGYANSDSHPSINDDREVVWDQYDPATGDRQIYSTKRGYLTTDPVDHSWPSINNAGDVVWSQYDSVTGYQQIFGLIGGVLTQLTSDATNHQQPSISNSGEVVWMQPWPNTNEGSIYKRSAGGEVSQVTYECPAGYGHIAPSINSCGDMTFTNWESSGFVFYRLGNASPCVSDPDQNNSMGTATAVEGNSTTMGLLDNPNDWEDWYSFSANAGDTINISVNWTPVRYLTLTLLDQGSNQLGSNSVGNTPMEISATAPTGGTYYVQLWSVTGRIGYSLTIQVGTGGGWCADPVASDTDIYAASAINDLGEMVWTEGGQIHSNMRTPSQVTSDPSLHIHPSLNNRGDIVWVQDYNMIFGLLNGVATQLGYADYYSHSSINDDREAVWDQWDAATGYRQIYSTKRGYLTTDPVDHSWPSINNAGDVVWVQWDPVTGYDQIFGLIGGAPVQLTSDAAYHQQPSISNSGDMVWSQGPYENDGRIYRKSAGGQASQVTYGCPAGLDHSAPSINSCGDITFTNAESGGLVIYRLGNASPCVSDPGQNDSMSTATPVGANSTTMGVLANPADMEDWYSFSASAGETIDISVNWTPGPPSDLIVELANTTGVLAVATEPGSPKKISVVAGTSGTYYVHLLTVGEIRMGYSLTVTIVPAPPASTATLTANPVSSQVAGSPVTLTAGASGGSGSYEYKFRRWTGSAWVTEQDYSANDTWDWDTTGYAPGAYTLQVHARNAGSKAAYEAVKLLQYELVSGGPASGAALTANPVSSQVAGSPVTLTAGASGGSGTYEYKFRRWTGSAWVTEQDYSMVNTWEWNTTGFAPGIYTLQVHVRNAGSKAAYEAVKLLQYELVSGGPASGAALTANPVSSQVAGSPVTLTAGASGGSGTYEYKFRRWTGSAWVTEQDYSPDNTWTWNTAGYAPGSYTLQVHVRNAGSKAAYEAVKLLNYELTPPPASSATLTAAPACPQSAGTPVLLTAGASGGSGTYEYKFRRWTGSAWVTEQDYSPDNTWTWNTTGYAPGAYTLQVHVRNAGSKAAYEAVKLLSCELQ